MMSEKLEILVREALLALGVLADKVVIERPADMTHGDYSTNAALAYAKVANMPPRELAVKLMEKILEAPAEEIRELEIAGPGFINFRLSDEYFAQTLKRAIEEGEKWGTNEKLKDLRKELLKIKTQISIGTNPESPGRVKEIRRTIAKLLTIKNQIINKNVLGGNKKS